MPASSASALLARRRLKPLSCDRQRSYCSEALLQHHHHHHHHRHHVISSSQLCQLPSGLAQRDVDLPPRLAVQDVCTLDTERGAGRCNASDIQDAGSWHRICTPEQEALYFLLNRMWTRRWREAHRVYLCMRACRDHVCKGVHGMLVCSDLYSHIRTHMHTSTPTDANTCILTPWTVGHIFTYKAQIYACACIQMCGDRFATVRISTQKGNPSIQDYASA